MIDRLFHSCSSLFIIFFLWAVALQQSKSESDRVEEKIDIIIKRLEPENAQKLVKELKVKYPKK
jgi:hypothetical protein